MKYFVTIGDRTHEVDVDGERVTVDGTTVTTSLVRTPGTPEVLATVDGRRVRATAERAGSTWRLTHEGAVLEVEALDERTRHIRQVAGAGKAASGAGALKAPMPGLVVRIAVAEGDAVAAGQGLVVLEAMKMENELKASAAGTVRAIRTAVGQAVEKGQVLVELE